MKRLSTQITANVKVGSLEQGSKATGIKINEINADVVMLSTDGPRFKVFPHTSDIPKPPNPYIAHPYTLLQSKQIIGRQTELTALTDWAKKSEGPTFLCVVAIGGMGKSALTWHWFNEIAPKVINPLAGRFWWSFYESVARFETFLTRALAYVSQQPREQVEQIPRDEQQRQLVDILDQKPFLLVLDGLERILRAYARHDAAYLRDDDPSLRDEDYRLSKATDWRVGHFLRRLATVKASRILVSSRLYPADLRDKDTGDMIANSSCFELGGLSDHDALTLWHHIGLSGERPTLLRIFGTFDNHPLVLKALAGTIKNYRRAPNNFKRWIEDQPYFNPFGIARVQQRMAHVLMFALRSLSVSLRQTLHIIAAFRMPTTYDTLMALLVGHDKPFPNENALDAALAELEDRSLLGWDKQANRYDLHPIVRGTIWNDLDDATKQGVYQNLHAYLIDLPKPNENKINSLNDLTATIELYNTLIGLGDYDDACILFYEYLNKATLHRLGASHQRVELLEMLFPDGLNQLPRLTDVWNQAWTFHALALAFDLSGQPRQAATLYQRQLRIQDRLNEYFNLFTDDYHFEYHSNDSYDLCDSILFDKNTEFIEYQQALISPVLVDLPGKSALINTEETTGLSSFDLTTKKSLQNTSTALNNLTRAFCLSGVLYKSEMTARRALNIIREQGETFEEAISLYELGRTLAIRGKTSISNKSLRRASTIFEAQNNIQSAGVTKALLAQQALWSGKLISAYLLADCAWKLAQVQHHEQDFISAARLQGTAVLRLGNLTTADERLQHALTRARAVSLIEEELQALIALAELRRQQNNLAVARDLLDDVWEPAECGPYPLFHADALNVLAQIERDANNDNAAVEAATQAYRLAWCDGPPYAYHWGLEKAKAHLTALDAPFPDMPPFDESKYEPMPKMKIDLSSLEDLPPKAKPNQENKGRRRRKKKKKGKKKKKKKGKR